MLATTGSYKYQADREESSVDGGSRQTLAAHPAICQCRKGFYKSSLEVKGTSPKMR